jgi:hypothetical protein
MSRLNIFLTCLFLLFAGLQYNDPDPWLWIPIYVYAAVACWLSSIRKTLPVMNLAGIIFCVSYAGYLFVQKDGVQAWATEHKAENLVQTMKATKPWIENTREFGGLLVVILVMVGNLWVVRRKVT